VSEDPPILKRVKSNSIKKIVEEPEPKPNFLSILQKEEEFNFQRKLTRSEDPPTTLPIKKLVLANLKS
jgi:hypothetical protein